MTNKKNTWLSEEEYKLVISKTPIPTVDLVILRQSSVGWEILLLVRKTGYAKGEWCLIGGRVRKNELLEDTIRRQTKDLGIEVKIYKPFAFNFPALVNDHLNQDKTKQPLCCVYPVKITKGIIKDEGEEYKGFGWFPVDNLPKLAFDHQFEIEETLKRLQKYYE